MKNLKKIVLINFLLSACCYNVFADTISRYGIKMDYDLKNESTIHINYIENTTAGVISVRINTDRNTYICDPKKVRTIGKDCRSVSIEGLNGNTTVWNAENTQRAWKKKHSVAESTDVNKETNDKTDNTKEDVKEKTVSAKEERTDFVLNTSSAVNKDFIQFISKISFFTTAEIEQKEKEIDEHIYYLRNFTDRDSCIAQRNIKEFIQDEEDSILFYKSKTDSLITSFMSSYYPNLGYQSAQRDSLKLYLADIISLRESNINRLQSELTDQPSDSIRNFINWDNQYFRIAVMTFVILVFIICLIIWIAKAKRKHTEKRKYKINTETIVPENTNKTDVVIVRKTTSILKPQNIDDVINNPEYLKIDCSEFCSDSAVKAMYIKNKCIKDIYNMYAKDLRNPDNPKEDGCMVLGRWIFNNETNEYSVSLEHVILPGDDAVFTEYELNFGGKIKLKVSDQLRKLRRETNLQYDLTCWVHSHPGLGVFFSNSDNNVQMQLKHHTHPNFLTALVIDILTPDQDIGIFTFKHDSTVNTQADLRKMYSLEQWYQWAVESDKNSFNKDNYYDVLENAQQHSGQCSNVYLNNGAIIDMGMLIAEKGVGFMGYVYTHKQVNKECYEVTKVAEQNTVSDYEMVGCFVIAAHYSIPSVRKVVGNYLDKIGFILVYSETEQTMLVIPVLNGDICTEEKFYGDQKMEDLKIWTRRKR